MILSYKNSKTRKVHEIGNPKGFRGLDGELAADRMDDLDAALGISDLSPLKSVNLHPLKGSRKGNTQLMQMVLGELYLLRPRMVLKMLR